MSAATRRSSHLRSRILIFVGALVVLSLLGSTISLYRVTEVNRLLDTINRVSVPLGRLFTQIQADADLFRRELDRGLGSSHWKEPHWRPRQVPRWISDVLENEVSKVNDVLRNDVTWSTPETRERWQEWTAAVSEGLTRLRGDAARLHAALDRGDVAAADAIYPQWTASMEEWRRQLQWGANEYERSFRQTFSLAESRVAELRTGLEMILVVVVSMSLLLLWLGERALRPLSELTELAREITRRGLRKEDKALLPQVPLARTDEVSQLAREFHNMATALLEREKTVEAQRGRVQEQNRLLREMGALNENVLHSIESVLIVTDLAGKITQCNPVAARWLEAEASDVIGTSVLFWPKLRGFVAGLFAPEGVVKPTEMAARTLRIEPARVAERVYGGHFMALRHESGETHGAIVVLDDLTDDIDLQERLRRAENMAAVGRMSAQVAHEVRNPLHSIGLEAEVAAELAAELKHPQLRQSLQSILSSVDRLEKITENYLKLSRLSSGEKGGMDLGDVLESVLATYTPAVEAAGITVDWKRDTGTGAPLIFGDRDLLEQVLGNLFRNAIQALESLPAGPAGRARRIDWALGSRETGRVSLRIEDNGPGIPHEIRPRLFTPFLTTRAQGTGLGLSFVKKVLEDHGAAIECRDRAGGGAIFELTFAALGTAAIAGTAAVTGPAVLAQTSPVPPPFFPNSQLPATHGAPIH